MKKTSTIFCIIIFFIGLSLLLYPLISNWINEKKQLSAINEYEKNFENLGNEEYEKILENAQKYNEDLLNDYQTTFDDTNRYNSQLITRNSNIMGYIEIEKLNLRIPIYHGTSDSTLQSGIGHMMGSSIPIGGQGTHSVLFGHSGLPTSKLFSNLDKMKVGEQFCIHVLKERLYYEAEEIIVIEPEELVEYLKINREKDQVTLVTCTPYGINTHRLLIIGNRTDKDVQSMDVSNIIDRDDQKLSSVNFVLVVIVSVLIIFISVTVLIIRYRNLGYIFVNRKKKR